MTVSSKAWMFVSVVLVCGPQSVGFKDGSELGVLEGTGSLGTLLGSSDGAELSEGESLGAKKGVGAFDTVGSALGPDDGSRLGKSDGMALGTPVGATEGLLEGRRVGAMLGKELGALLGLAEGEDDR